MLVRIYNPSTEEHLVTSNQRGWDENWLPHIKTHKDKIDK